MVLRNVDWQADAACRNNTKGNWFPEGRVDEGRTRYVPEPVRYALAVCGACPVREECREHALAVNEKVGVWGGMLSYERARMRRRRMDAARRDRNR